MRINVTKVIGVIQLKGGAGKSTVATNLAGMLNEKGSTLLIDSDEPQYSAEGWYLLREEADRTDGLKFTTCNDETLPSTLRSNSDADYIVIDGPPRVERTTKLILAVSDLVIIPLPASMADMWAAYDLEEIVKQELKSRKSLAVRLLMNQYRGFTNVSKEIAKEARSKEMSIPVMKTMLGYRSSYMTALGTGRRADEVGDSKAREEINQLTKEVLRLLR